MKIAIEATPVQFPLTGIGVYADNLLRALAKVDDGNEYFLLHWTGEWSGPDYGGNFIPVSYRRGFNAAVSALLGLNSVLSKIGADVFHATATTGIPFQGCRCPAIVTVHDLFPLYGELPFSLSRRIKFRTLFSWCAKNADAFVCNSEDTKEALLRHYPRIARERTFVTLLGGSEEARLEIPRSGVPEGGGILLCLGGVERRKGQLFLLDVYKRLADSGKELPKLVFAGEDRGDGAELARRIGEYGLSGKVEWLGHVDGDARRALFADTLLFLMPSSHEGFGIPLVDMMELGIPFIASDIPVFREVAGPAGCLRPLGDADAWSAALSELLDSEEEMMRLVAAGRKRVEDFSWKKCAGETLDVYRKTVPVDRRAVRGSGV